MGSKRFVQVFIGNWVIPMVAYISILLTFIVLGLVRSSTAADIGTTLLSFGALWLLASAIYQFRRKKSTRGIVMVVVTFGGMFVAFLAYAILSMAMTMIDGDHWADNLTIPEDIPLSEPLGEGFDDIRPDSVLVIARYRPDLELYNSFQPGMYMYDIWLGRTERGIVYLTAHEITRGDALSAKDLKRASRMDVYNPTDSIVRFASETTFKIYEGDWSKPYAARFEVWFKPATDGPEVKLLEKNYKIEGWMH